MGADFSYKRVQRSFQFVLHKYRRTDIILIRLHRS